MNSLRSAVRLNPLVSEYQFKLAQVFLSQNDFVLAKKKAVDALLLEPTNYFYHLELANILASMNETAPAETEFLKALNLGPMSFLTHYELAKFYSLRTESFGRQRARAEFKKAISLWEKGVGVDIFEEIFSLYRGDYVFLAGIVPNNANLRFSFAQFLRGKKKYPESIREYKKSIILARKENDKNTQAEAYNWIGVIYSFEKKQFSEALPYFEQAVQLSPRNAVFAHNLGDCYFRLKQYGQASESFETALAIDPTRSIEMLCLGYSYEMLGLKDKAKFFFEEAIRSASGDEAETIKKEARARLNKI
ncbi:MAG: tetratricopeptide repeat protein [Candidatus Omnitrophica bacterium]|nr:tetratricopeptide repeat protein [Candidatus Omnitrophota bacterium]MDD5652856.1 tetratricopeptide repeat protein [Candidatus Omnitrophota bacterium]